MFSHINLSSYYNSKAIQYHCTFTTSETASMSDRKPTFMSFWTGLRKSTDPGTFNRIMDGLSDALHSMLDDPNLKYYTPQFLAYKTILKSASQVSRLGTLIGYPRLGNRLLRGTNFVDVKKLKSQLTVDQHKSGALLLDILEGSQIAADRYDLAMLLDLLGSVPERDVAISGSGDKICIPMVVDIKDLELRLLKPEMMFGVYLTLDVSQRILSLRKKVDGEQDQYDLLIADANMHAFWEIFVCYIRDCLTRQMSINVLEFASNDLMKKTIDCKEMVENLNAAIDKEFSAESFWAIGST
ncbi:hypothetical protein F4678DRAFT_448908 [Xylaria arbuscula]|nr:hypothetical protein F4678DRAFT_448908 [Xylaria arbuscula]